MKTKKNKYKEKEAEKRRKEWDKTRREIITKNGCWGYDHIAHKTPEISTRFDNTQYF